VGRLTISGQACVDIFGLLIAMAWADERLDDREKDGVRGAAEVLNLPKELRDRLDKELAKPAKVETIAVEKLSPRDRSFAYACAAWMAAADEHADEKEEALLDKLAERLGLEAVEKAKLERLAREDRSSAQAGRNWSQEVVHLFKAILPRIEQATPASPIEDDEEIEISVEF
jgi:uncharacterized membrane protein YebE (DUF533 family)